MKSAKIFLVEDDLSFGSVLKSYLELNDFQVDWVDDGKYAVEHFRKGAFDICILDVMLPHVDGFTIAGEIRKINNMVPIVFLTAKSMKEDTIEGFTAGADDYITKPFSMEELLLRINAILRRVKNQTLKQSELTEFRIGKYSFNSKDRKLEIRGKISELTTKESDLLKLLCLKSPDDQFKFPLAEVGKEGNVMKGLRGVCLPGLCRIESCQPIVGLLRRGIDPQDHFVNGDGLG